MLKKSETFNSVEHSAPLEVNLRYRFIVAGMFTFIFM